MSRNNATSEVKTADDGLDPKTKSALLEMTSNALYFIFDIYGSEEDLINDWIGFNREMYRDYKERFDEARSQLLHSIDDVLNCPGMNEKGNRLKPIIDKAFEYLYIDNIQKRQLNELKELDKAYGNTLKVKGRYKDNVVPEVSEEFREKMTDALSYAASIGLRSNHIVKRLIKNYGITL